MIMAHCLETCLVILVVTVRLIDGYSDVLAKVNTEQVLHVTDERYLSVVMGQTVIRHDWGTFNVSSPKILTLASALAPAIFRVGGNEADLLIFNESLKQSGHSSDDDEFSYNFLDYGFENYDKDTLKNFSMTTHQWDQLNKFTSRVGWNLLFDLNVLLRRDGEWDADNALKLLDYSIAQNYTSNLNFELGNEPNEFQHYINRTLDPVQLGKDFLQLHYILKQKPGYKKYFTKSMLVGPDTTKPRHSKSKVIGYLKTFLKVAGESLSAITWHQYYMDGREATASNFIDPEVLELFPQEAARVKKVLEEVGLQNKPLMLGETGSCWGGGAPNLSNRYAGGFLWLDKLGLAAQMGHSIVMRQTFYEGNYGLIDRDLFPSPDYWLSLVYKTLVGSKVFDVTVSDTTKKTRVYAHCTNTNRSGYPQGALTMYALNLHSEPVHLNFDTVLAPQLKHIYWFIPASSEGLSAKYVRINGKKIVMPSDTTLPIIKPMPVTTPTVTLSPTSFGYIVFPKANISKCIN